jgi:hypothetical protein
VIWYQVHKILAYLALKSPYKHFYINRKIKLKGDIKMSYTKKVKSGDWITKKNDSVTIYLVTDNFYDGDYDKEKAIINIRTGNYIKHTYEVIKDWKLNDAWKTCNHLKKIVSKANKEEK